MWRLLVRFSSCMVVFLFLFLWIWVCLPVKLFSSSLFTKTVFPNFVDYHYGRGCGGQHSKKKFKSHFLPFCSIRNNFNCQAQPKLIWSVFFISANHHTQESTETWIRAAENHTKPNRINGRQPQWKMTSMEDNLNGRRPQWKTYTMEDDHNGRQ